MKSYKKEVGIVWRQEAQLIRVTLERLVRKQLVSKLSVIAEKVGMTEDEFASKISINPRTPLTWDERITLEHLIFQLDANEYDHYLQQYHMHDLVEVRSDPRGTKL